MSIWNHTLSIICLVYDGNQQYLKTFLEQTKKVKITHEIIVVDNRDSKEAPLECDENEVVVVKAEKNLGILDGRRLGFEHSKGEYIWFVDIDDELYDVYDAGYGDCDIISFSFNYNGNIRTSECSGIIEEESVLSPDTMKSIYVYLWNKWIKRDVLKKTYESIPSFFCVYREDVILVAKALEFTKDIRTLKDIAIYNHVSSDSSITLKQIKTEKEVDCLFAGFEDIVKIEKESKLRLNSLDKSNIFFYLEIASKSAEEIKPYFVQQIAHHFSREYTYGIAKSSFGELLQYLPPVEKKEKEIKEDTLSIVILFCDKDYQFIPDLLKNISEKVYINYEIILIDNRDKNKNKKMELDNYKYKFYKFGYNATQIQGRKKGVELSCGKYIWFVDADDEVCEISCVGLQKENNDMIVFGLPKERLVTSNILNYRFLCEVSAPLWNKWIKREVMEKVEEHIPETLYGSASEDVMLVIGCLKYSNSVKVCSREIYVYNKERSACCCNEITDVDTFLRTINGYDGVKNCMLIMLSDPELNSIRKTFNDNCGFFFKRLACCSIDIIKDCLEILTYYFTEKQIIQSWRMYVASSEFTREKYMCVRTELQNKFKSQKDKFIFINTISYLKKNEEGKMAVYKQEQKESLPDFID